MLETLREFAVERLEAGDTTSPAPRPPCRLLHSPDSRCRAAHHERCSSRLGLNRLRADLANHRAALGWTVRERRDTEAALALAATLGWPASFFGLFQEGRQWIAEALAHLMAAPMATARRRWRVPRGWQPTPAISPVQTNSLRRLSSFGAASAIGADWHLHSSTRAFRSPCAATSPPGGVRWRGAGVVRVALRSLGPGAATGYLGASYIMRPGHEAQARELLLEGRARCAALDDGWGTTFCCITSA